MKKTLLKILLASTVIFALALTLSAVPRANAQMSDNVAMGSRGNDVVLLQNSLEAAGYFPMGLPKGYFGPITREAVIVFQKENGLAETGAHSPAMAARLQVLTNGKFGMAMSNGSNKHMMPDTNTKAADLRVLLNAINREHANLASVALRKGYDGASDFNASFKALDNNSVDIGKSIRSVYGADAEEKFLEIWRSHITFFANYTLASKANDQTKKDQAVADLAMYVNRISDFLSAANPNLPRAAVHQLVTEHVRLLRSTIDKYFAGDLAGSYADQHATDVQIGTGVADAVAGAIVKQYPEKF